MKINRRDFALLTGGMVVGAGGLLARPATAWASQSPFYTAHVYPGSPVTLSERVLREHGENVIALSFDDGPDVANDTEILRLLAQYQAVATFFVIGNRAASRLDMLKAMIAAGCEIGNHSWTHPMLTHLGADAQLAEMRQTNDLLAGAGIPVNWLRPPYGDYDTLTRTIAESESLETILWSVDPSDWRSPPPDTIVKRITENMGPGSVILMHSTRAHTVQALPRILEFAKANNYRFVTLSEWKQIMIRVGSPLPS
jgi:peptidoglycan/xylan/chitin deacetylase (PgdA/CDA1 family)